MFNSYNSAENKGQLPENRIRYLEELASVTSRVQKEQIALGCGGIAALSYKKDRSFTEYLRESLTLPSSMQHTWSTIGSGFCCVLPNIGLFSHDDLALRILDEPVEIKHGFYRGLGMSIGLFNNRRHQEKFVRWDLIPFEYQPDVASGYGFSTLMELWRTNIDFDHLFQPDFFSERDRIHFAQGYGSALAWLFPFQSARMLSLKTRQTPSNISTNIQWAYFSELEKR